MNINLFPDDVLAVADTVGMDEFGLVCKALAPGQACVWCGGCRNAFDFVGCSSPMGIDYPKAIEDAMIHAVAG